MREPREIVKGKYYHVTARTNRGEMLFKDRNTIKQLFLEYIKKAKGKYTFSLKNLCIMDNHIHLQIRPSGESQLCDIMKSILGGFAAKYNKIHGLKGHVFYDRFKSKVIHSYLHFYRTYLYIANNPVRANMVNHPFEYAFSGFTCLFSTNSSNIKSNLKELILSILDPPDKRLLENVREYLKTFSKTEAKKRDPDIAFLDKKPGRPRKQ